MKSIKSIAIVLFLTFALGHSCNRNKENPDYIDTYRGNLIDSLLTSAVNNNEIPGAVAYIVRDGKEVYHKAFGWRSIEKSIALEENDIFRMASMTKALTAIAVLQLYERGLLFLDDKVFHYIPEFKNPRILIDVLPDSSFTARLSGNEITIRQLLTHTSGIGYGFQDDIYNALIIKNNISEGFEDDDRTSLENIQRLAKLPLLHEPGEKYTYGLSYDVLGVIIELISGMRYDQYIQSYILEPLVMNNSYFIVPVQEHHRLVTAYQPAEEKGKGLELTNYPDTAYPKIASKQFFSGGSDLCSTAEDYAKFIQMILYKGVYNKKRILGGRFIDMMLSKQTAIDDGNSDQGFAAWVTNKGGAAKGPMAVGSFGFGGFWDTYGWADPNENFVAVLLLQMYPNNQHKIHEKFQNIVYGVIKEL